MQHTLWELSGPYSSINPLVIGHEKLPPGPRYGPFRRKNFIFQYVFKGTGVFECPYGTFKMDVGDMFIMHKGDLVKYTADELDPWEYAWIEFECNDTLPDIFNNGKLHCPEVEPVFREIINIPNLKTGQKAYTASLIFRIIALLDSNENERQPSNHFIQKAVHIIKKNYIQKLTVNEIAKQLNIDRSYLYELFLKEFGKSPKEYIDEHRLSAAIGMIESSSVPISDVAASCGYKDTSSFSRAFVKRMGITPSQYRKSKGRHK